MQEKITIEKITDKIECHFPLQYATDFDNVGLLVGDKNSEITGVLITLDTTEKVVEEAIKNDCNFILSFHPIIFSGLKKITGRNYVERAVMKAIKNDIAIYAIHTALDVFKKGVSYKMAQVLGLENLQILIPEKNTLLKLTTYTPLESAEKVRKAMLDAGAGRIGDYSDCSFNLKGIGTYKGGKNTNPHIGEPNVLQQVEEASVGVVFERHLTPQILKALFATHPYESVAYDMIPLENKHPEIGMGMLGDFSKSLTEIDFLDRLKNIFGTPALRHSQLLDRSISKVAVLGGAGSFAIEKAIALGADAYVSADFKYHDFFKAEGKILLVDIGHYESEQFTKDLLFDFMHENFTKLSTKITTLRTNPVFYS